MPDVKQAHLQAATSPSSNQSLQKSLLCPPGKKNKKSPPLEKNKTLQTHNPTDKNEMTNSVDKQKGMSLDRKEGQLVTKCMCHKGFSGYSSVVARLNFCVGGQVTAPQSLTAHTLERWTKFAMHNSRSHGTSFSFVELPFLNFVQRSGFHPLSLAVGNLMIYGSFCMANFVQLAVCEMASEIV